MEEVTQALKIKTDTEESLEKTQGKQKTGLCLVALPAVAAPVEVVWPLSDESPVAAIQDWCHHNNATSPPQPPT